MNQILINKELRSPAAGIDENDGRNLSERAYDQLLDRMLSGELPAGTLLQERPLADADLDRIQQNIQAAGGA